DHRALLPDVIAVAGSIFSRLAITKIATKGSTASWFLASAASASLVCHLFFQRLDEMPRHRLVGWFEYVARADPAAFQRHRCRDTREMEVPLPGRGNLDLSVGNRLSISYLE